MCSGVLIGSFLDVLEFEAGFEGVRDWAAEQSSVSAIDAPATEGHRLPQRAQATGWLSDIQCS